MKNFKPINVILIAGQSNAVGCTSLSSLPDDFKGESFPEAILYQEGNFSLENYGRLQRGVTLGMGNCSSQMGIEYGISKALSGAGEFAIIRYALGGSNIYWDWLPPQKQSSEPRFIGQAGYSYSCWSSTVRNGISALIRNGYAPKICALVWMQGESDADKTQGIADSYFENLTDLVSAFRAELMNSALPILVGEIATNPPFCPWSDNVRDCQRRYCGSDQNAFLISTSDISIGHDGLHFDGEAVIRLGMRFGEMINSIIHLGDKNEKYDIGTECKI